MLLEIMAAISGEAIIQGLIWLIVIGLVFWLLMWLASYVGLPEPFAKVFKVILAIAAVVILINFLLGLGGRGFIKW